MVKTIWNFGDLLDDNGARLGKDDPALIHGDRIVSWPEMSARSNNVARWLLANGAEVGDSDAADHFGVTIGIDGGDDSFAVYRHIGEGTGGVAVLDLDIVTRGNARTRAQYTRFYALYIRVV